jgi:hypothetical protein
MLSVHYSGDIVSTPDKEVGYLLECKRKRIKQICKYNQYESACKVWQNCIKTYQNIKRTNQEGRCELDNKICCPGRMKSFLNSLKKKTYKIDYMTYRKLASASHSLVKNSPHKVLFLTLTFPKFKHDEITDKQANECFSKFVENMRTNYQSGGYIAVRERGSVTHRLHFHLLIDLPFIDFRIINGSWLHSVSDFCIFSNRALFSDKKARFILDPIRATKYVCKYFAKVREESESKIYFISNNLIIKPYRFDVNGSFNNVGDFLDRFRCEIVSQSDYHTTFRACNPEKLTELYKEIIYPLFGTFKNDGEMVVRDDNFEGYS